MEKWSFGEIECWIKLLLRDHAEQSIFPVLPYSTTPVVITEGRR